MHLFKKNLKKVIYFFCIGFVLNCIPNTLDIVENRKNARLEFLEKEFLKKQQENVCKEKIEYTKFFEMGFKEIAQKRLISCMKQSNFIQ